MAYNVVNLFPYIETRLLANQTAHVFKMLFYKATYTMIR